jgi:hypothetical protein
VYDSFVKNGVLLVKKEGLQVVQVEQFAPTKDEEGVI